MKKKILIVLFVAGLAATSYFVPHDPELLRLDQQSGVVEAGDVAGPLALAATRVASAGAGQPERWLLRYGPGADSTQFTLDLATPPDDPAAATSPTMATLTATAGADASSFLGRLAAVLGAAPPATIGPPRSRLDLAVSVVGTHLSPDTGAVGVPVIAGAFSSEPRGDWHVLRVSVAPGGGEFFLALNAAAGSARVLMRDPAEGALIVREFSRLLGVAPASGSR